ncbi:helix-turn-helix domain-containing protein [Natrarchaeobaculum aegyptiacum]|uniref:Bacterio-opsin activator n=1 Tax=Natrarchaeobaculum aegyptiacum TaxID=745377 RepID=A0A2Z2HYP3_9EURY|nr:helix-turn-helix domain-containing protein [Natrarchaeobaculum aegyptiacum]ARS88678.1 bacterio-opsin activator [Natrarchaeobaculum aegyptiacum]
MSTDAADLEGERSTLTSVADGGIVAQVRLDHPKLLLRRTLRRVPDVSIEPDTITTLETGQTVAFLLVYADAYDAFETALEIDPTVTDPVLVDRYPDRRVYRVTVTERARRFDRGIVDAGGRLLEVSSSRDGWKLQVRFPDREALVSFNDHSRDRGLSVAVEYLRVADDGPDGVPALTEKQQELLTVAYQEGYFHVPRGISQNELADRLGVSKSAVSQRLRRAIGSLCAATLTPDGCPDDRE